MFRHIVSRMNYLPGWYHFHYLCLLLVQFYLFALSLFDLFGHFEYVTPYGSWNKYSDPLPWTNNVQGRWAWGFLTIFPIFKLRIGASIGHHVCRSTERSTEIFDLSGIAGLLVLNTKWSSFLVSKLCSISLIVLNTEFEFEIHLPLPVQKC